MITIIAIITITTITTITTYNNTVHTGQNYTRTHALASSCICHRRAGASRAAWALDTSCGVVLACFSRRPTPQTGFLLNTACRELVSGFSFMQLGAISHTPEFSKRRPSTGSSCHPHVVHRTHGGTGGMARARKLFSRSRFGRYPTCLL